MLQLSTGLLSQRMLELRRHQDGSLVAPRLSSLWGWGGTIALHGLARSFPARPYLPCTHRDAGT